MLAPSTSDSVAPASAEPLITEACSPAPRMSLPATVPITGCAGAVVSITTVAAVAGPLVLPARSITTALMLCEPSDSALVAMSTKPAAT